MKPEKIALNSKAIKNLINIYKHSVVYYYCNRTSLPKYFSFVDQKNCKEKDKWKIIFLIVSSIHLILCVLCSILIILYEKKFKEINMTRIPSSVDNVLTEESRVNQNLRKKLKALIILSILNNKIDEDFFMKEIKKNSENIFFMNKRYFEQYYYNEIDNLVKSNNKLLNNINVNDLNFTSIEDILIKFDKKKLEEIDHKIKEVSNNNIDYKAEIKEIKNLKIVKDLVYIDKQKFEDFKELFNINFYKQNFSFVSIDNENLFKFNNKYYMITNNNNTIDNNNDVERN